MEIKPPQPQLIIFDYGETVLSETPLNLIRAYAALRPYIRKNPHGLSIEQLAAADQELFDFFVHARGDKLEFQERVLLRLLFERLDIDLSITLLQAEQIIWEAGAPARPTPGIISLLAQLRRRGIPSGIISNLPWSGCLLEARLQKSLPEHSFDFVITSSEYGVRKPSPLLFELALQKVKVSQHVSWFCGDNVRADIEGAYRTGITPVWYDPAPRTVQSGEPDRRLQPQCPHWHIRHWAELSAKLDELSC
ncbi:HAD family hydrolase [Oscillospiraceae bacterium HV4-5-C5C]|nr:HAD family hydrolase [Oscillospiraceae bacterium HV4-5-C5C]